MRCFAVKKKSMKKIILLLTFLPLLAFPQPKQAPFATIREGKIFYYIPRGEPRLLPLYKPGFVEILQTISPLMKPVRQVNDDLKENLEKLKDIPLNASGKQEFLEKLACLILLNYGDISPVDPGFVAKVQELKKEKDEGISGNAEMVIRLYDMYKK